MSRYKLVALAMLLVVVAPYPVWRAFADSTPTPPAPPRAPTPRPTSTAAQPGDILWTFAQQPIFNDSRIALAIATKVDARLRPGGVRIFYAGQRGPQLVPYISQPPAPADQAPLLLAAAGFRRGLADARVVGGCRIWASPAPAGISTEVTPADAAGGLSLVLRDALAELGAQTDACVPTTDLSQADVLVWVQGGPPPVIPSRRQATFLDYPVPPEPPSRVVAAPATGDGGLR